MGDRHPPDGRRAVPDQCKGEIPSKRETDAKIALESHYGIRYGEYLHNYSFVQINAKRYLC
jgi:hypothetical protein